jgi:hypothetical protein
VMIGAMTFPSIVRRTIILFFRTQHRAHQRNAVMLNYFDTAFTPIDKKGVEDADDRWSGTRRFCCLNAFMPKMVLCRRLAGTILLSTLNQLVGAVAVCVTLLSGPYRHTGLSSELLVLYRN